MRVTSFLDPTSTTDTELEPPSSESRYRPLPRPVQRERYCCHMNAKLDPLVVDRLFFTSLTEANLLALDQVLAGDFILIDVMSGSEVTKSSLLAAIGSGQVRFESIEPGDNLVRLYQTTAVVTGRTT